MKYTYHFCVNWNEGIETVSNDGVLCVDYKIEDAESYKKFKDEIRPLLGEYARDSLWIKSLSLIDKSDSETPSQIHVMVAENDGGHDPDGPLIFEQYANKASRAEIEARMKNTGERYGKLRIAKLVFLDEASGD